MWWGLDFHCVSVCMLVCFLLISLGFSYPSWVHLCIHTHKISTYINKQALILILLKFIEGYGPGGYLQYCSKFILNLQFPT